MRVEIKRRVDIPLEWVREKRGLRHRSLFDHDAPARRCGQSEGERAELGISYLDRSSVGHDPDDRSHTCDLGQL